MNTQAGSVHLGAFRTTMRTISDFRFVNPNFGTLPDHIVANSRLGLPLAKRNVLPRDAPGVCICAPGPTLLRNLANLRKRSKGGWIIWAIKESAQHLSDRNIQVHAGVAIDPGPEQHLKTPVMAGMHFYLASSCSPLLFKHVSAQGAAITVYHSSTGWQSSVSDHRTNEKRLVTELDLYLKHYGCADVMIGGYTVANRAVSLAKYLGAQRIVLYGAPFGRHESGDYYAEGTRGRSGNDALELRVAIAGHQPWLSRLEMLASALHLVPHIREGVVEIVGESLAKLLSQLSDSDLARVFPGQWPPPWAGDLPSIDQDTDTPQGAFGNLNRNRVRYPLFLTVENGNEAA